MRAPTLALWLLAASCRSMPADAQAVTAQRTTLSSDTATAVKGSFELEAGGTVLDDGSSSVQLALNHGVSESTEVFFGWCPYVLVDAPGGDARGPGDVVVGARHRFVEETEGAPSLAIQPTLKLPTADDGRGLGTGEVDLLLAGIATKTVDEWTLTAFAQLDFLGDPGGGVLFGQSLAAAAACPLPNRFGLFAEVAGVFVPELDSEQAFTTIGLTYNPDRYLVFDVGVIVGLDERRPTSGSSSASHRTSDWLVARPRTASGGLDDTWCHPRPHESTGMSSPTVAPGGAPRAEIDAALAGPSERCSRVPRVLRLPKEQRAIGGRRRMKTTGFGSTDIGRERATNEDAFLVDDALGIYAVSDGMGGHAAGEEAARLAIEAVRQSIVEARAALGESEPDHSALRRMAADAMRAACARVHGQATTVPELSGMGCTLTLLLTAGARAVMAHVGDTRLYLCREGSTWQLSSDHTLAADLVRRGEITPDDASEHPYSGALTRALGSQESVVPETLMLDIFPDDVFLLCSDGLSHYVDSPGDLSAALGSDDLNQTPHDLIARANDGGGRDNITAIVVQVVADAEEQEAALADDTRAGLRALRKVSIFDDVRFADLLRIFRLAEVRTLAVGEEVTPDRDRIDALYIPLVGEIDVVFPDGDAKRVRPGEALGTTSLLAPRAWPARASARSDVRLLVIEREALQQLARRRPWTGVRVLSALGAELESELSDLAPYGIGRPQGRWPWWHPGRWLRGATR